MSNHTTSIEVFIEKFCRELEEENAAIFAGAGLSVDAGFVDWKGLLRPLAKELSLDVDRESDLVRIAQFHVNQNSRNRHELENAILNEFSRKGTQVTQNHRILARLPIETYWTTNYDACIEQALEQAGKGVDVKSEKNHLPRTLRGRDAVIYKMHGDYRNAGGTVLTKEDYERYHLKSGEFLTALAGDLVSKTFLFIGFSFSDPNLDYVLGRLHTAYAEHLRPHYCFVKSEAPDPKDQPGEFEYRKAKQEHFVRDLHRYNIRAVMVDEYSQIPEVLLRIEERYKSKTVFISGAANEYGSRWPERDVLQFIFDVASGLVAADYRVVTGFGLGVGSSVVNGALHQIYKVKKTTLKDQLVLRPFPQGAAAQQLWTDYRKDMLDLAGVGLYMFGNKLAGDPPTVSQSKGMFEEFDLAVAKGLKVLPLGFTGYVAKELYDRVAQNFAQYYPKAGQDFADRFKLLGDPARSLPEQLKTTLEAVKLLQAM